jgi:hypothetical protein
VATSTPPRTAAEEAVVTALREQKMSKPPYPFAANLEGSTMLMTGEEGAAQGSGFFVKTKDADGTEKFQFVTVRHVPEPDELGFGARSITTLDAGLAGGTDHASVQQDFFGRDATWSAQVDATPGNYDLANDLVKTPAPEGAALEVAREGDLPQPGDKFVAAGYPEANDTFYSTVECTFQGYAPGLSGEQQYLFDCPSVSAYQRGMSGGPIVRASDGTVFAAVSRHTGDDEGVDVKRIVGSPVYQRENGTVAFGSQPQLVQPNCYTTGTHRETPHSCSIVPGTSTYFYYGP